MTVKYLSDGVSQTDTSVRIKGPVSAATNPGDGSTETCEVEIRDPTGTLSYPEQSLWAIEEDACSQPRIFTGLVMTDTISRGPFIRGPGRIHTLTVFDLNALLRMQPARGADAKRKQETGDARVAWLLSQEPLAGVVFDNGLVGPNPNLFDEADFTLQYANDILPTMCVSSVADVGRIFFAYWDPVALQPSLFLDLPTAPTFNSSIRISNVPSDVSANPTTTFHVHPDPTLTQDGTDIYCSVFYKWTGGTLYRHNDATHAAYFAGRGYHRQAVFETTRVGSLATAIRHADAWLANHAAPVDTIRCTVKLPASAVNLIDGGMRLQVRFEHFPGYTDAGFTWVRVAKRTLPIPEGPITYYDVQLVLTNRGFSGPAGGGTGGLPHPPPSVPDAPDFNTNSGGVHDGHLSAAPAVGDKLLLFVASRLATTVLTTPTGWTKETDVQTTDTAGTPTTKYAALFSKVAVGTETDQPFIGGPGDLYAIWNFGPNVSVGGVVAVNDQNTSALNCGTVAAPGPALVYGCSIESTADFTSNVTAPGTGVTEDADFQIAGVHPFLWAGHKTLTAAGSTAVTGTLTNSAGRNFWGACSFYVVSTAAGDPPGQGQEEPWTVVAMTIGGGVSRGTAPWPFADQSLEVRVQGLPISPASYVIDDASCGDFHLIWELDPREVVTVKLQGR